MHLLRLGTFALTTLLGLVGCSAVGGAPAASGVEHRALDARSIEPITGEVVRVESHPEDSLAAASVVLRGEHGQLVIELGPPWFLEQQRVRLVTGSKISLTLASPSDAKKPVASEIVEGERRVLLRGPGGEPAWRRDAGP